nr:ribonuclease H-like domain-containing protein [Tanacetum cinerariifolium]
MVGCNSSRTPVDIESKLSNDGDPVFDSTLCNTSKPVLKYLIYEKALGRIALDGDDDVLDVLSFGAK